MKKSKLKKICFLVITLLLVHSNFYAQELEPRNLTNMPIGTNVLVGAYNYSSGNVLLDPALPIRDLKSNLHMFFAGYLHSFNLFGLSSKIDAVIPFGFGDWTYDLDGLNTSRKIDGWGDPRIRLAVNLYGAPALERTEFKSYKMETIIGVMMQVVTPFGHYEKADLINLGSNRWAFRTYLGAAKSVDDWIFEAYIGGMFFTANSEFLGDFTLKQNPLGTAAVNVIYDLGTWGWVSLDGAYGYGGKTEVNGIPRNTEISSYRFGVTISHKINATSSVKLTLNSGKRIKRGPDFDAIGLSYQFLWF